MCWGSLLKMGEYFLYEDRLGLFEVDDISECSARLKESKSETYLDVEYAE
jgi:hypothetical protein